MKGFNYERLNTISQQDLNGKLKNVACEERDNCVCKLRIEINEANGLKAGSYKSRDNRFQLGRYFTVQTGGTPFRPIGKSNTHVLHRFQQECNM